MYIFTHTCRFTHTHTHAHTHSILIVARALRVSLLACALSLSLSLSLSLHPSLSPSLSLSLSLCFLFFLVVSLKCSLSPLLSLSPSLSLLRSHILERVLTQIRTRRYSGPPLRFTYAPAHNSSIYAAWRIDACAVTRRLTPDGILAHPFMRKFQSGDLSKVCLCVFFTLFFRVCEREWARFMRELRYAPFQGVGLSVCVRERERDCVCVCACEWETRERKRETWR